MRNLAGGDAGMSMLAPLPAGVNQVHARPLGLRAAGPTLKREIFWQGASGAEPRLPVPAPFIAAGGVPAGNKKSIRFSDILKAPLE